MNVFGGRSEAPSTCGYCNDQATSRAYNNNLDWHPVPLFAPWKHCSQCGLFYDFPFSQVSLASTIRGSPLAARGGTMGEKWWPNGAWDMHPGFFYMPQICNMGPIILLPFGRKAC